jgi:hypothetical protein
LYEREGKDRTRRKEKFLDIFGEKKKPPFGGFGVVLLSAGRFRNRPTLSNTKYF